MLLFFMLFVIDTVFSIAYLAAATGPGETVLVASLQFISVVLVVVVAQASSLRVLATSIAAQLASWLAVYALVAVL